MCIEIFVRNLYCSQNKFPETRVKPMLMWNFSGIQGECMIFISRPSPIRNQGRKPGRNPTQIRIFQVGTTGGLAEGYVTFLTRRCYSWAGDWAFSNSSGESQSVKRLQLQTLTRNDVGGMSDRHIGIMRHKECIIRGREQKPGSPRVP